MNQQRIEYLDVLRGISVLFIFIANILFFSGYYFFDAQTRQQFSSYPLDRALDFAIIVLVEAKFYSLFSLLFGIGFYIQMRRFSECQERFASYMSVRLAILLLIGLIHIFFIWLGDIITLYALMGFVLLGLRNLSDRALTTLCIILLLLPMVHTALLGIVGFYPGALFGMYFGYLSTLSLPPDPTPGTPLQFLRMDDIHLYMQMKILDPLIRLAVLLADARFFKVLGIFCLGIVVGRRIYQQDLLENTGLVKRVLIWGLLIGLPCNLFIAIYYKASTPELMMLKSLAHAAGVVPLALAYAAAIALLMKKSGNCLSVFSPMGRMAFTCYLSQSLFGVLLFSEVGLGLIDDIGLTLMLILAAAILVLQLLFCRWWLDRHKQGPIEKLWRTLIPAKLEPGHNRSC